MFNMSSAPSLKSLLYYVRTGWYVRQEPKIFFPSHTPTQTFNTEDERCQRERGQWKTENKTENLEKPVTLGFKKPASV